MCHLLLGAGQPRPRVAARCTNTISWMSPTPGSRPRASHRCLGSCCAENLNANPVRCAHGAPGYLASFVYACPKGEPLVQECDRRLHRLVSYMNCTKDWVQHSYVGDNFSDIRLGLFTDADFAGDKSESKSTSGVFIAAVGPHTYAPHCKHKQETRLC